MATIYIVNELVRRHLRAYKYKGDPNVDRNRVADTILKERTSYEITSAQKIDPALIEQFLESWKDIFGQVGTSYSHDSSELFHQCREDDDSPINSMARLYGGYSNELVKCNAHTLSKVLDDAVALMHDKWHAEHDPEKFFRLIIADRKLGKETMDKCKKVVDFHHNQKDLFKQIWDFVKENEDNFSHLPEDCADDISFIKKILTDEWPVDTMPSYKKRMNILTFKLEETRKELRKEIEDAYTRVFDELIAFAEATKVPATILPSLQSIIVTRNGSNVISTLKLNLAGVDSFRNLWMGKIMEAKPQEGEGAKKIRKVGVKAVCKTPQSIKNQADIEAYVAAVRTRLEEQLSGNDELLIL